MTSPRILIVDDERPLTDLLWHAFANEGWDVAVATDGIDCMNKVASFEPDLVVMDIMMPKLDGIETTRLIRRNRAYAATIIVALSARIDAETRTRAREAGADLFLRKPFAIGRLIEKTRDLLAERSRRA